MRKMIFGALALLASVVAANAAPITFASTVAFSGTTGGINFTSSGLNTSLNVGDAPTVINNFIVATIGNGTSNATGTLTATFAFTNPTGATPTLEQAALAAIQVNGGGGSGTLSIDWPSTFLISFTNGTKLSLVLSDLSKNCTGNNCLAGTYNIAATVQAIAGPTAAAAVPEPLTLAVFGAGLAGAAAVRRRKSKKAAA